MLLVVIGVHCKDVLIFHRGRFRERQVTLLCVVGTIIMGVFISTRAVRGGSERLRNSENVRPNPVLDQRLCGNGDQHAQMLIVGAAASVIPLSFVTLCVCVVVQLPGRVRHGDTEFLHSYAFLFFRFHPEAYWYVLVLLVRNLAVALVLILPDAALQWCCLVILLVVSVVSCVGTLPWRVHAANVLDICTEMTTARSHNIDTILVILHDFSCCQGTSRCQWWRPLQANPSRGHEVAARCRHSAGWSRTSAS